MGNKSHKTKSNNNYGKLILIGDINVGKTSIVKRFIFNQFKDNNNKTNIFVYYKKTIKLNNNQDFNFNIWDTFGQEKFRALAKVFYHDCVIAILVYDITSKKSFENIKNYWWEELKKNAQNSCTSK